LLVIDLKGVEAVNTGAGSGGGGAGGGGDAIELLERVLLVKGEGESYVRGSSPGLLLLLTGEVIMFKGVNEEEVGVIN
jgi:hypothetical protein